MAHAYPKHMTNFSYVGKYHYSLTFCTIAKTTLFTGAETVQLVLAQILRAGAQYGFEVIAYCFMPDHRHLIVQGLNDGSDCRTFIKAAKQYSGYYFKQTTGRRLWQRYSWERLLRDDVDCAVAIKYVLRNPVEAGLAKQPSDYPFLGSFRYSVEELIQRTCRSGATTPRDVVDSETL